MKKLIGSAAVAAMLAAGANAAIVKVDIYGEVEWNGIRTGVLNNSVVTGGSAVHISFLLDSTQFVNDPDFPTRGYFIDHASFSASYGSVTVGMQNPYPYPSAPFFVVRNNDPMVDGFFLSNGTAWPFAPTTDVPGIFENFGTAFEVSYDVDRLSSLDIMGALGSYDYTGMSTFYMATVDGGMDAMGILYTGMTISEVPAPATMGLLLPLAFARRRR
ncbi:MAG: hypothetical protein J0L78_00445 [Planctomycetes bacterium]|nr:hypothetical protein [Planctomycetota bacterium]